MIVDLLNYTPIEVALEAALICTNSEDKIKNYNPENFLKKLIDQGHESVIEHIVYNFRVDGVSRALLQELSRHRHISLSVKSTRWALRKFAANLNRFKLDYSFVKLSNEQISILESLDSISEELNALISKAAELQLPNDILKYYIQESTTTKLMLTLNARELRHIMTLRTSSRALREFRELCYSLHAELPDDHLFIYKDIFGDDIIGQVE